MKNNEINIRDGLIAAPFFKPLIFVGFNSGSIYIIEALFHANRDDSNVW